jgi:hypothetical protein
MPPEQSTGRHVLAPHPASLSGAVTMVAATVTRPASGRLRIDWELKGDLSMLRLPEPRPAVRADGLWQHTCLEAFLGRDSAPDYWEYNFSPSGAWAAYHFTDYREGMAPLMKGAAPSIACRADAGELRLEVTLDLEWLARTSSPMGLRLGLSAVVEDRARVLSYWALKHPAEKPDFHHQHARVIALD